MAKKILFTSESVTEGHPDKVCDQVSDAILDELLKQDKKSRVAVECLTTTGLIVAAGEVTTSGYVDVQHVVRNTLNRIGYTDATYGISGDNCAVLTAIHEQSQNISVGVDDNKGAHVEQGAGDQGMMFGFACNETPELMPLPISMAHKLTFKLSELRRSGNFDWIRPDGKSQVTVEYVAGKPTRIDAVVVAVHHDPKMEHHDIKKEIIENVIKPVCGEWVDKNTKFFVNETGIFAVGGPQADAGVTGRKIIVDTYGGMGKHGGGAFSGKDPSKVDRSGAYAGRYIAKNIVASGLANRCEVQLAFSIGVAEPVSILVDTFGTAKIPEEKIVELVRKHFPIKPADIIKELDLLRPIYEKTAAYGHFGREDSDFTWEKTDKAEILKQESGLY